LGETRPAWKVLRVLGNLLELGGFDFNSSEDVRAEALACGKEIPAFVSGLDNAIDGLSLDLSPVATSGLQRIADVPIHFADSLVRRSPALQQTGDAEAPLARMNPATLASLGLADGQRVKVGAGGTAKAELGVLGDAGIPVGCVRIAAAHPATIAVGALTALLTVEKL
jgi:NADH-quinone oxidoreductase subunit G